MAGLAGLVSGGSLVAEVPVPRDPDWPSDSLLVVLAGDARDPDRHRFLGSCFSANGMISLPAGLPDHLLASPSVLRSGCAPVIDTVRPRPPACSSARAASGAASVRTRSAGVPGPATWLGPG